MKTLIILLNHKREKMNSTRILYIDDELDLLDLAKTFFADESLPIDICSTFDEALLKVRQNQYDLIISDAKMPTGSGYELCKIIRSEGIFVGKIILVTGNVENLGDEEKTGYDLIIYKPIRFQDLVDKVKSLLSL